MLEQRHSSPAQNKGKSKNPGPKQQGVTGQCDNPCQRFHLA